MYLNLGDVAKDDIFEKMSLVASQLPLTREPRKECGAKDSAKLAVEVRVARVGVMYRQGERDKLSDSAKGIQSPQSRVCLRCVRESWCEQFGESGKTYISRDRFPFLRGGEGVSAW